MPSDYQLYKKYKKKYKALQNQLAGANSGNYSITLKINDILKDNDSYPGKQDKIRAIQRIQDITSTLKMKGIQAAMTGTLIGTQHYDDAAIVIINEILQDDDSYSDNHQKVRAIQRNQDIPPRLKMKGIQAAMAHKLLDLPHGESSVASVSESETTSDTDENPCESHAISRITKETGCDNNDDVVGETIAPDDGYCVGKQCYSKKTIDRLRENYLEDPDEGADPSDYEKYLSRESGGFLDPATRKHWSPTMVEHIDDDLEDPDDLGWKTRAQQRNEKSQQRAIRAYERRHPEKKDGQWKTNLY